MTLPLQFIFVRGQYLLYVAMFNAVNKSHQISGQPSQFIAFIRSHSSSISRRAEQYAQSFSAALSNQMEPFIFTSWNYPIDNPTSSPLCSKSIANCENKKAFRCFDCMEINTALLCYDCFVQSNHKGHSFLEFESAGGCCDCGDTSLWNENGFCPTHSNKNHQANISPDMRELFVKELGFVFYLYFWCVENRSEHPYILDQYGELLFSFVNRLIQLNFQTKILVAELMNSTFHAYPPLNTIKDTILSSIFNLSPSLKILEKLQKFAFEMYPVQSFRSSILCEYFKLTYTNTFTWEHPIKKFNFQYMTCIKIINRLISSKEMLPIQLNPNNVPSNTGTLISIFKKLYEDCNYLHKMKDSKQYFNYHFQLTNACDMAFYRSHSLISEKQQIFLDEYYLKFLGISIHHILERKDLLVKNLKELFDFIVGFQDMTFSLAQERAFAMFMMAYLQGSLERLYNEDAVNEILTFLGINMDLAAQILAKLVKKGLKNAIILSKHNNIKPQRNNYENFFFATYPEKNFLLHLDLIYHKILMLLSRQYFNYWNIAQIVLFQFVSIELQSKDKAADKLKDQNPQNLISYFSLFFAKMYLQQINQIAVCNMIGIVKSEKISQIYLKVIAAYANKFSVKQIKMLCSYFVSNSEVFEDTLKTFTIFEDNKIKLTVPTQPIQKLIYMDTLKGYRFYNEIKWDTLQKVGTIISLEQFPIFNEDIIGIIIKNTQSIISSLSRSLIGDINVQTLERQVVSLIQIFLLTHNQPIKFFFIQSVECLKRYLHSDIISHINVLCKQRQELKSEMEKGEKQREDDQKRKREKIDLKRKEKELVMRKNQELMLKQYNAKEEAPHQKDLCIYCKEEIKEDYHLLSYVNLTNLISEFFLKEDNRMHIFFTTCGHKVHEECYAKYGEEEQTVSKCFLCKKRTNIIIPNILANQQTTEEGRQSIVAKFLDSVFATVLSQNDEKSQIFNKYFQEQQEGELLRAILRSIVKQAIYYGLHAFQQYTRYSLHTYQLIFAIIKMGNKKQVLQNLSKLQEQVDKNNHSLALLENYAYSIFRMAFAEQQEALTQPNGLDSSFASSLLKITRLIMNPSQKIFQISNLPIINRESLLRPLPLGVGELHQSMGKCPVCNKLTNWLYYCLLCEWKACNKETAAFHKHSKEEHLEGSVFISAANGKISVICMGLAKNQESLYQNPYGQSYTHTDQNSRKNSLKSFCLNTRKYQKIFQKIISHNILNLVA